MISSWFCNVISEAYRASSEGDYGTFMAKKIHEVQDYPISVVFRKNFAVQQVLRAGVWSSHSTFTSFYLKDVTHISLFTFSIVPCDGSSTGLVTQTQSHHFSGNYHSSYFIDCYCNQIH